MSGRLDLGLGMVVFPELADLLDGLDDRLECYEVEPQTFWLPTGDPHHPWRPDEDAMRDIAGRDRPVLAHGVSAPVGGAAPDPRSVAAFAASVATLMGVHRPEERIQEAVAEPPTGQHCESPGLEPYA